MRRFSEVVPRRCAVSPVRVWCVLVSCLLAACASTPERTSPSVTRATDPAVSTLDTMCTDVVAAGLGDGTLCVDSGFRMDADRFAFANWGRSDAADENVTVQTLVDLFGHSAVCMPGPETECVIRPRTRQALEDWNVALEGGRCEGMAVLSQRMHLRWDSPQDFGSRYASASALPRSAHGLTDTIVYWWATQFMPEVTRVASDSRARTPLQLVVDLIRGLANGTGQTVGMYDEGSGHSVTPFAVTRRNDAWVIHVYDNNDPGRRHEIVVSATDGTWSYDGPDRSWNGGSGTLELTPMAARNGPFTCEFCNDTAPSGVTTLTISSAGGATVPMVMLDAGDAGVIEQTPDGTTVGISGARLEAGKGGPAATVRVYLPATVRTASVELRAPQGVPAPPAVITVRRPGSADIQLRGVIAAGITGAARVTKPAVEFSATSAVVRAHDASVAVTVAGESNLGTVTVLAGDSLRISGVRNGTVEVNYDGPSASGTVTLELAPSFATDTDITVKNGLLGTTASATPPQAVSARRSPRTSPLPAVTTTVAPRATDPPSIDVTLPG